MFEIIRPNETQEEFCCRKLKEENDRKIKLYNKQCARIKREERIGIFHGEKVTTTICCICKKEVTYKLSDIPKFIKQGRWNKTRKQLDACLGNSLCQDYYKYWKDIQFDRANTGELKAIYNPNQINRESKGLIL